MKINTLLFLALLMLVSVSCKEDSQLPDNEIAAEVSTFYLIRHAEKDRSDPENVDPELNQKGLGRAMHWAEILSEVSLDAIYSTDYERTSMTAAPSAVKQDITIQFYDPNNLDVEQFKRDNAGKNVLVVGHSNSTPALVNKMIGEERFPSMDDRDNGSLFIVQQVGNRSTVTRLHFNCNCPD
ncbi:SixA phosphatase family protein [Robiginitalea sp. IMCC44478]|uniref:SixA phosphatase family protein n=1 Tax=Robiginitalea sp. IMCC44478 TaxID=3459122 RepID=UPI004042DD2B